MVQGTTGRLIARSSSVCIIAAFAVPSLVLANAKGEEILVEVMPVILTTPTPDPVNPRPTAPDSTASVGGGEDFFVEVWASNVAGARPGLACVSVDLMYPTTHMDALPPIQDGPLFPITPVEAVFDDVAGLVDDCSSCQGAPAIEFLGVNEWVMIDRVRMHALEEELLVGTGEHFIELADAGNPFAGISLYGDPFNVDPVSVDFQSVRVSPQTGSGACCNDDTGSCRETTDTDCDATNETYRGDGTDCGPPNPCPPPTGACCYSEGTCSNGIPEADCVASSGRYLGDGLTCEGDPDGDGFVGCDDVCASTLAPAGVNFEGRPLGDFDGDCDVDLVDYAVLQKNMTWPKP